MSVASFRSLVFVSVFSISGGVLYAQSVSQPTQTNGVTASNTMIVSGYVPWEPIPEANIVWRKRVWREIDVKAAQNEFFNNAEDGSNSLPLFSVLLEGAKGGKMKLYDAADDRFTKQISYTELEKKAKDMVLQRKITDPTTGMEIGQCVALGKSDAMPVKYLMKEDWLFLKDKNKMVVRIVGIAPVMTVMGDAGEMTEKPLFWIYYPDNREYLSQFNSSKGSTPLTWDSVFEGRQFSSKITKTSNDKHVTPE